jgi:hypothetical protein
MQSDARARGRFARDFAQFDAEAIAAVDTFRREHKLNYAGNPPGLVDERLVTALRAAYLAKTRPAK